MSEGDLSGSWSGFYNYPAGKPPVPFEAELNDSGGRITGTTSELDPLHGTMLVAVLDGHRTGRSVEFVKMYECADESYDSVRYQGEVSGEGDEINGRWLIPGAWSGAFLMVRASRSDATEERMASVGAR